MRVAQGTPRVALPSAAAKLEPSLLRDTQEYRDNMLELVFVVVYCIVMYILFLLSASASLKMKLKMSPKL